MTIADPTVFRPLLSFPITKDDRIFRMRVAVRTEIVQFLEPSDVQMLGYYRRGHSEKASDNPTPPPDYRRCRGP